MRRGSEHKFTDTNKPVTCVRPSWANTRETASHSSPRTDLVRAGGGLINHALPSPTGFPALQERSLA